MNRPKLSLPVSLVRRAPKTTRFNMLRSLLSLTTFGLALGFSKAADDCSTYTSCGDCPAGCTWADKWDSTGWHCFANEDVQSDWLVMDSTDCMDCAQKSMTSCDKCNKDICGWCGGSHSNTCMSDSDKNAGICKGKGQTWTGSMDDCPSDSADVKP